MTRYLTTISLSLLSAFAYAGGFNHLQGLNPKILSLAEKAYNCKVKSGLVHNSHLVIVDFTRPSSEKRMWVLDMKHHKIDYNLLVAHGVDSGDLYATEFSNKMGSHESSLGLYVTQNSYDGKFGYALRLQGLEPGINNNAYSRAIVMHGSKYVNQATVNEYGLAGETWGCFGLDKRYASRVIDTIRGGSLIFAYSTQEQSDPNLQQC